MSGSGTSETFLYNSFCSSRPLTSESSAETNPRSLYTVSVYIYILKLIIILILILIVICMYVCIYSPGYRIE